MKLHARVVAQPLPFAYDSLKGYGIDEEQLKGHYQYHHCDYAAALEALVAKESNLCTIVDSQDQAARRLEMIYRQKVQHLNKKEKASSAATQKQETALRKPNPLTSAQALMLYAKKGSQAANLASMVANHDFFWRCLNGHTNKARLDDAKPENVGNDDQRALIGTSTAHSDLSSQTNIVIGPETTSYSVPSGARKPALVALLTQIEKDFGSVRGMMETFEKASLTLFGSGWVWLAWSRASNSLVIMTTRDSINPLTINANFENDTNVKASSKVVTHEAAVQRAQFVPLLGCDMWEHAYLAHGAPYQGPSATTKGLPSVDMSFNTEKRRYLRKYWSAANWSFAVDNFEEVLRTGGTTQLTRPKKDVAPKAKL